MVVIAGTVAINPAHRAEAAAATQRVVAATKAEAGCLAYDFYADLADPNLFHVFEEWETEEALAAHLQQPHTVAFLTELPNYAAGAPSVYRYVVSERVSLF